MTLQTAPAHTLLDAAARVALGRSETFGGGNAWRTALENSPAPDRPLVTTDRPLLGEGGAGPAVYSLAELDDLAGRVSAWYLDLGVRPRDRVVLYLDDSFENQLHLVALAQIGAIPVLLNGHLAPEIAAKLIARADPVGIVTDPARRSRLPDRPVSSCGPCWIRDDAAEAAGAAPLPDSARYRHGEADPVAICHTSGTTGLPKLVVWSHAQSTAGPRFRLRTQLEREDSVLLSALPQSHSGAIGFTFYALLAGIPLVALSESGPEAITDAARRHRPTTVLAFNEAFSALAIAGPDPQAFDSVASWINIGDSAHHEHVKRLIAVGHHTVRGRRADGSIFGDGLGSSELGWAALHRVVIEGMTPRPGFIGTPTDLAEVRVLREDGTEAEVGEVGRLGVRSPAVAPGYWDDSDRYYRSVLNGYWTSGDLVYRDAHGDFYLMDRGADTIQTEGGVGYSLLMEEIVLNSLPEAADCAVVAGRAGDKREKQVPVALVRARGDVRIDADRLLRRADAALAAAGQPALGLLEVTHAAHDVPTGPTGKTLKRELRERYRDIDRYVPAEGASVVARPQP